MDLAPHHRIAIVGTGFGGIAAAIRLMEAGERDLVLLERAEAVGGVWRDNVYPGAACDVRSHLYALDAAPNASWTRAFSPQPEIRAYLDDVTRRLGVRAHIRFGHDVTEAAWDEAAARWRIETSRGPLTADVFVAAAGQLAEPKRPKIPGLRDFPGDVLHTARWDRSVDLAGKRVAVVGTGASAVQLVPAIQPVVGRLVVFQRSPGWVIARGDRAYSARERERFEREPRRQQALKTRLFRIHEVRGVALRSPWAARLAEAVLARRHLRRQVADPALRRRLTPSFRIGCKRILLSDDYYPALQQPNVTLVPAALAEVRGDVAVGADGAEHAVDAIALATGFHATDFPFAQRVVGRGGRRLAEVWADRPVAHLGTTVAGFPNLFWLAGPNTTIGHTSMILTTEAQVEHLAGAVAAMRARGLAAVEPRPEAQASWIAEVDALGEGTAWLDGCTSWYLDERGRNVAIWPGSIPAFQRRVAPFDPADYALRAASGRARPAAEAGTR